MGVARWVRDTHRETFAVVGADIIQRLETGRPGQIPDPSRLSAADLSASQCIGCGTISPVWMSLQ